MGQAHVEDLDGAVIVQQQIARLDVAMDHALSVGVLEPFGRLKRAVDRLEDRKPARLLDQYGQILPVDVVPSPGSTRPLVHPRRGR